MAAVERPVSDWLGIVLGFTLGSVPAGLAAGSLEGAGLFPAGSLWHDGLLEVTVPIPPGVDPSPLLSPSSVGVESGLGLSSVGLVEIPTDSGGGMDRRLVIRLDGPPLYGNSDRPWFFGLPHFDPGGGAQPGPRLGRFRVAGAMAWSAVGANESGLSNGVVAEPKTPWEDLRSFAITSGGLESGAAYDELVMVHEFVRGDFDRIVQVVSVTPTAPFAGAGLMARESLDAGKTRESSGFSRFVSIDVPGWAVGGSPFAMVARTEGSSGLPFVRTAGRAELPNAWVRLIRKSDIVEAWYRASRPQSPDEAWEKLGSVTLPGLAPDLFVGPHYSPQLKFSPSNSGTGYPPAAARLADYGEFSSLFLVIDGGDPLSIHRIGETRFLHWDGFLFGRAHLEESTDLANWSANPVHRGSPAFVTGEDSPMFWRLAE